MTEPTAAGWFNDPSGRYEHRYWDGDRWTEHVSIYGQQQLDSGPVSEPGPVPPNTSERDATHVPIGTDSADRIQRQVAKSGAVGGRGDGTVFDEPVLVVNQKAKLIEINNEYAVYDQNGTQIAAVRQVGQSAVRKAVRVLTSFDQYLTQRLQIVDLNGKPLLDLTRPAKVFKSTVVVSRPGGEEVGRIVQENMVGKIRFGLVVGDRRVGSINAENWRAWNFSIRDESENEVARITKTWEGLAKTMFTTADNYVVNIQRDIDDPLRTLVVASALSVDTALKQDQRGFN